MHCKLCRGVCELLGMLGFLNHYRCRDCGAMFSKKSKARRGKDNWGYWED